MPDEKVITRTIESFDSVLPNQNKYVIIIPNLDYECMHVKLETPNVYRVVYDSDLFWSVIGELDKYKEIIIHFMTDNAVEFVNRIEHPNITWMTWGADLYNELLVKRGFTLYANPLIEYKGNWLVRRLRYMNNHIFNKKCDITKRLNAVSKIRNMCVNSGDYELLQKYYPEVGEKFRKHYFYYPIEEIIPTFLIENVVLGNDIMVGNSAALTNNHVSIYKRLSKLRLNSRKIVSPLSYGGDNKEVLKQGVKILGERFVPLIDFVPLEEYNRLLLTIRTYIFGSYRQQAMGNIIVALFLGAAVFIDKRNTISSRLKEIGCVFFYIDELEDKIDYRLTKSEIEQNRRRLIENYGKDKQEKLIVDSFG